MQDFFFESPLKITCFPIFCIMVPRVEVLTTSTLMVPNRTTVLELQPCEQKLFLFPKITVIMVNFSLRSAKGLLASSVQT